MLRAFKWITYALNLRLFLFSFKERERGSFDLARDEAESIEGECNGSSETVPKSSAERQVATIFDSTETSLPSVHLWASAVLAGRTLSFVLAKPVA